jgi:hypothetical protein
MKSAIECHIHAVFAGLVKLDDVCGLGWQQGMFVVLGQKNWCLVKTPVLGAWSKRKETQVESQVLGAW